MTSQRDYTSNNSHRQIQMGFLNKKQSQRHAQILQQIMQKNFRKQSGSFRDLNIRDPSSAGNNNNYNSNNSGRKLLLDQKSSRKDLSGQKQKIRLFNSNYQNNDGRSQKSAKEMSLAMKNLLKNLNNSNQINQSNDSHLNNNNETHMLKNTNSRNQNIKNVHLEQQQKQDNNKKQNKYTFNIISFGVQVAIAYALTIGIDYLYQVGTFPYYQLILIAAFTVSINPYLISNILVITAAIIAIVNNYINMAILTYPSILICYLAVLTFNEKFKIKIFFILALAVYIVYGFIILPALYNAFDANSKIAYYYLFPLFMFIFRVIGKLIYWTIGHCTITFLQLPFFMTGLEYGTILSLSTSQIEFWYLMVFFTLEIIIQRTQFMAQVFERLANSCYRQKRQKKSKKESEEASLIKKQNKNQLKKRKGLLIQQSSGYNSIHSLHIVCLVYIYGYLPLYYYPYSSTTTLSLYVNQWYKPLLVWILGSIYQAMCIALQRKRKDKLLIGFKQNGVLATGIRSAMLILGFWFFYLGLGVGNYIASLSPTTV